MLQLNAFRVLVNPENPCILGIHCWYCAECAGLYATDRMGSAVSRQQQMMLRHKTPAQDCVLVHWHTWPLIVTVELHGLKL